MRPAAYGPDYDPAVDEARLTGQLEDIRALMSDGVWRTLQEIEQITNHPSPSVSARLRYLRSLGYVVDKRRRYENGGTWEYRVTGEPSRGNAMTPAAAIQSVQQRQAPTAGQIQRRAIITRRAIISGGQQ